MPPFHTVTLQRKDLTVTVTLIHDSYGTDRFGFHYSRVRPGHWQEHGTIKLWREILPKQKVARQAA